MYVYVCVGRVYLMCVCTCLWVGEGCCLNVVAVLLLELLFASSADAAALDDAHVSPAVCTTCSTTLHAHKLAHTLALALAEGAHSIGPARPEVNACTPVNSRLGWRTHTLLNSRTSAPDVSVHCSCVLTRLLVCRTVSI